MSLPQRSREGWPPAWGHTAAQSRARPGTYESKAYVLLTTPDCELVRKQRLGMGGGEVFHPILSPPALLPLAGPPGPMPRGGSGILWAGGPSWVMRPSQRFAGLTMWIIHLKPSLGTLDDLFTRGCCWGEGRATLNYKRIVHALWMDLDRPIDLDAASQVALVVKNPPAKAGDIRDAGLICRSNPWRRQWHPTPVLLPGESHGRRSLVGCSPWGR